MRKATPREISVSRWSTTQTWGYRIQDILLVLLITCVLSGGDQRSVYACSEKIAPAPALLPYSAQQPVAPLVRRVRPFTKTPEARAGEAGASAWTEAQKQLGHRTETAAAKQFGKLKKREAARWSRRQASMHLVSIARGELAGGKPDAAIRTLEKAVRIDSGNGEAFIILARAWKRKGDNCKALEFAKKAEILCRKQPVRLKEVYLLESDLYRELGNGMETGRKLRVKAHGAPKKPSK